jgi:hypothetical protein
VILISTVTGSITESLDLSDAGRCRGQSWSLRPEVGGDEVEVPE